MYAVDKETAMRNKHAHMFVPGRGYVFVGPHPMPATRVCEKHQCEPLVVAAQGTWHKLRAPNGKDIKMQWMGGGEWMPPLGSGNRVGFKSEYLAAHGWTYKEPWVA